MIEINEAEPQLTLKQQKFVEEYLIDLNATQAAIRSGYAVSSARQIGSENLSKPYIQDAIAIAMQNRLQRVNLSADYVMQRLVAIDQMDILEIFYDNGQIKPLSDWPLVWRQSIGSFETIEISGKENEKVIVRRVKLPDKLRNLEMLGRHTDIQAWIK
jgi:phage terminase small subunit